MWLFTSIQEDLQRFPHSPQLRHFAVSITGAKRLNLDTSPSSEPTGQMLLHQIRPHFHESTASSAKVTAATARVTPLFTQTSVV